MRIRIKRIYESPESGDGQRILVDRLWPRGISRQQAAVDVWLKSVAPSDELRRWFRHQPEKWERFQARYIEELQSNPEALKELDGYLGRGRVTLLYAARETRYNNAVVLKQFLETGGVNQTAGIRK
ncbi:MAG: DUF488 domain-containing protein [Sedimenticola sp.]|nr:DUF488 domain-containing protein [Sedimenticola sp.]